MTPWLRRLHKWLGLVVGLQFIVWMLSGLAMSVLPQDRVEARAYRAPAPAERPWPTDALPAARALTGAGGAHDLRTGWLLDRPVYHLVDGAQRRVLDARSGQPTMIDAALAQRLAEAAYAGPGRAAAPQRLERSLEARGHEGPLWRVDFADDQDTSLYLSAWTGDVLEHRNATWRLFDVFWMLHIMDYTERVNFNNPLVVGLGIGGLWMALSGLWLLLASLRLREFVPSRWRRRHELAVYADNGGKLRTLSAPAGDSVYLALARHGLQLPSNCGGGQSCGLCEVRFRGTAPAPTAADRAHLPAGKLKLGYRLACNLALEQDTEVEVAGGAALWSEQEAEVERVTAVTPFLREIVLRPAQAAGAEFRPGAYLQVHVPAYEVPRTAIVQPEPGHGDDWAGLDLPETVCNREPVRRAYSLALPVTASDGRLVLLARFSPGRQDRKRQPPGKGSTYLYTLQPGDRVRFSGPFGDFALTPGPREKVFIGGGAGMAPLRAMLRALLDGGCREPIHFWYGARSRREAPYVEELEALARQHPNLRWHLVLSDPPAGGVAPGHLQGLVHEAAREHLLQRHPDLASCDFYLCGPPAMLAATRQLLQRLGVPDGQVAFDDFKI